jgi:RNA 2',3'-cyclic 3'-phosphodiesterase
MIRAFVAVELDLSLRQALGSIQAQLRNQLRRTLSSDVRIQWVRPESIHLTLKFLGDIPEERVPDIHAVLIRVAGGHVRFAAQAEGLGVFPDARSPRVLWVGLTTRADALTRLAADVETALDGIGFPPEGKPFHPHLTLARIKEQSRAVGRALADSRVLEPAAPVGAVTVNTIALMKSELKPSGSLYTKLREVPLKEA